MLLALPDNKPDDKLLTNPTKEFDLEKNTVSRIDFFTTNFGIFGLNLPENKGGVFWPRNSLNQYIFGGGFWFGAQKFISANGKNGIIVEKSYNPTNGRSWFIPGLIKDGDSYQPGNIQKYKCYFSTDYNTYNGKDLNSQSNPNWPLWINDSLYRYHYGTIMNEFVSEKDKRNLTE